jgi:UPF0755 protein
MKKKIFLSVITIILIIAAFIAYKIFGPAVSAKGDGPQYLYVKTGSGFDDLKNELKNNNYISSTAWFDRVSQALKFKTVKPGRYKLTDGMSLYKLIRMLRSGQQSQVNLVITKLRTREDLARRVGKLFECDSLQMIQFLNSNDSLNQFNVDSNTVTALALPLTYSINWNTTPKKILQHMHKAWTDFWTEERKHKATALGLTPLQASILASIVDEETNKASDKPNISSVYLNRIKIGMPLQADPTVKFGLKDFGLKRIRSVHTQQPSAYNTYLNKGLPPGPICTPQQATIDSVLNTPTTNYLYFVASKNFDGSHIFNSDYDEHMKYAREYQKELTILLDSANKK